MPLACLAAAVLLSCDEAALAPVLEEHTAIFEAKAVDHYTGTVDEEPLPIGFDRESWREYLLEKISTGQRVNIGGVEVIVAEMDEPLSYEGDYPSAEMVPVSAEELELAGASPGDELPGSTPLNRRLYVLDTGRFDSGFEKEPMRGPNIGINYDMWHDRHGAGLAFGRDSGIEVAGCSVTDQFFPAPFRQGEACFDGAFTGHSECVPIRLPVRPCQFVPLFGFQQLSTWYAKKFVIKLPFLIWDGSQWVIEIREWTIWLVYKPETWKNLGTDAWKSIEVMADSDAGKRPVDIRKTLVTHNDRHTTWDITTIDPFYLFAPPHSLDLTQKIRNYKWSLVHHSASHIVQSAIGDYAQAASKKYPVYPRTHQGVPILWQGMKLPKHWCSEFTSWAIRDGVERAGYPDYFPEIPIADDDNKGVAVAQFHDWASNVVPDRFSFFGSDVYPMTPFDPWNGANDVEWAALAEGVQAGDYVARWHEVMGPDDEITFTGHSMIFVGWLSGDGTGVGPQYFDSSRPCNRMRAVGGNERGLGIMNSGLGSVVNVGPRVVCQRPNLDSSGNPILRPDGFYEDPPMSNLPLPGTCPWRCDIRLYDTRPGSNDTKAGFFVDTSVP